MAGRDDGDMKRVGVLLVVLTFLGNLCCHAQKDAYLKKLADDVVNMRKSKSSSQVLNNTVVDWSSAGSPKVTLMDDIGSDREHECRGSGANKFRVNQLVTYVYGRQKTAMVSKGDYFNSTEKDICYSAIEKTIMKGCTVTYKLVKHIGEQEFFFISFNPKTSFSVTVNGIKAEPKGDGVMWLNLGKVKPEDEIVMSISNNSSSNESFVILNHNPQK